MLWLDPSMLRAGRSSRRLRHVVGHASEFSPHDVRPKTNRSRAGGNNRIEQPTHERSLGLGSAVELPEDRHELNLREEISVVRRMVNQKGLSGTAEYG